MKPSIVDGIIQYLSVSSITKFDPSQFAGCQRRWWFAKVQRVPEPEEKQHVEGQKVHSEIEHYIKTGENILGDVAKAGLRFIPRHPELLVERDMSKGLTADGIPVIGRIDLIDPVGMYIDEHGEYQDDPPDSVEVIDWKTTSNLKYAKTPQELLQTVQMSGYGMYASIAFPGTEYIRLSHVYFQTRGAHRAVKSTALFSLAEIQDRWHTIEEVVKQMRVVAKVSSAEDVPPNVDSCNAYRGCPFKSICPIPKTSVLTNLFSKGDSSMGSLFDRLRQQSSKSLEQTAKETVATTQSVINVPLPTKNRVADLKAQQEALQKEMAQLEEEEKKAQEPPTAMIGCSCGDMFLPENLKAHQASCTAIPIIGLGTCQACQGLLTNLNTSRSPAGRITHIGCPKNGVIPPDATVSSPTTSAIPIPPGTPLSPALSHLSRGSRAQEAPPSEQPRRRGRKPMTEEEKEQARFAREQSKQLNNQTSKQPDIQTFGISTPSVEGIQIYVDCVVQGISTLSLDEYIDDLTRYVCENYKVPDIRLGGKDTPLSYGGWKGVLTALVKEQPPEPGGYSVFHVKHSEIKQVVVEALTPLCSLYVCGV